MRTKPDLTPVTEADTDAERAIRSMLQRTRPRDMVVGEELEPTGHGRRQWVLDPIDGTKNFVRGVPVWATLVALVDDRTPVVGVVSAPALGRRWWGAVGTGAFTGRSLCSARELRVSAVDHLGDASLSYSSLSGLGVARPAAGVPRPHPPLLADPGLRRLLVVHDGRRGRGRRGLRARAGPARHGRPRADRHRGRGRFTSLDGTDGPWGADAVASNGALHEETLAVLHGGQL